MYDALKACLPAGTVAGAPKLKAMQVIDELEHENGESTPGRRLSRFNGNLDLCIAIRTIVFKDSSAYVQAGAGIVHDSNPETEYTETVRKATAMLEAIRQAEVS